MYPAYTFVTEKLKWTKEIRKDTWYLDIMEMVYRNAVSCGKISVISGENARVQIPAEHFIRDEWENLIQDTEQTGMFYERFLKRLEEYRKQGKIRFVNEWGLCASVLLCKTGRSDIPESGTMWS